VHEEGATACGQLTHYGNQAATSVTNAPLLGPSRLPDAALREPVRPLDTENMARIRRDFVAGARNLAEAGFDAVELKLAHDGLLRQFLSPLTNDRADEYGGSRENRVRYPLEVARSVRAAIGDGVALGVRLTLDECLPGGYDLDEGIEIALALEAAGLFDYVSADVGIWASVHMVVPPMSFAEGYSEHVFGRAAEALSLPVFAFGRIQTPEYAERIVAEGKAEVVGMARQLLADPEFARKAFAGEAGRIRPCTYCNQLCVGNALKLLPVACTVNPLVGRDEPQPAIDGRIGRVVVVGGGPAGLEAARIAGEAGHEVTLFEASRELGGQLALAARARGREQWGRWIGWAASELEHFGVRVRLGVEATAEDVRALLPDAVVLACGATFAPPPLAVARVIGLDEFLRNRAVGCGERVALVDQGAAGLPLWTAALEAAARDAQSVAIVTPVPVVAGDVDGGTFLALHGDLVARGVYFANDCVAAGLDGNRLDLVNVYGGAPSSLEVDVVVSSTARVAVGAALAEELADLRPRIVGDALAPRDAAVAIREGFDAVTVGLDRSIGAVPAQRRHR
jgi:2,4-dienoyl-CoA reductase (NADPH2)